MKGSVEFFAMNAAIVACGLLAGCNEVKPVEPAKRDSTTGNTACRNYIDPISRRLGEWGELDRNLYRLAGSGGGNPVKEAGEAAGRGDFRFIGYSRGAPGIFPGADGIECRPDLVFSREHALFRTMVVTSDVPLPDEAREEAIFTSAYSIFGQRYNEALLANPRYPYRDICRPFVRPSTSSTRRGTPTAQDYGYRDLKITDTPIDLGEAARRGTLDSLDRMAKAAMGKVNLADPFGMTPLAWAIVYNRREHAQLLLRLGSSPAGAACQDVSSPTSPMQLARDMRWKDIILEMGPYIPRNQAKQLEDAPKPIPSTTRDFIKSLEPAVRKYAARMPKPLMRVIATVTVNEHGKGISCSISQGTGVGQLDNELCAKSVARIRWEPALDEFGFPARGNGILRVHVVAKKD